MTSYLQRETYLWRIILYFIFIEFEIYFFAVSPDKLVNDIQLLN